MSWNYLLLTWALLGHLAIWVFAFNRLHASGLPCRVIKLLEKAVYVVIVGLPAVIVGTWVWGRWTPEQSLTMWPLSPVSAYVAVCCMAATYIAMVWTYRKVRTRPAPVLVSNDTTTIDVSRQIGHRPLGDWSTRWLERLPGNQILRLDIHEEVVTLPRLPRELSGLSITHFSDLHFTGQLTQDYFDHIVDQANALDSDLIAIAGDIVDNPACISWFERTLGRLRARYGVFFVLGNHEIRHCDTGAVRRALVDAGLVDLGGRQQTINVKGTTVMIAGNESPWFPPATVPVTEPVEPRPLLVLLSHSPDQIHWARRRGFDLVLAGHTHGGQIRFPVIGPVVSPSRYGVKYASGLFYEPPTVMHVSRGISGVHPLRWNCPPELTKLVLRSPST